MEKMMDHQYKENGMRNIYSNYNQMRACIECLQINKKIIAEYIPLVYKGRFGRKHRFHRVRYF